MITKAETDMKIYPIHLTVHDTPELLGKAAAAEAAATLCEAISRNGHARVLLAAAPSQLPTLSALAGQDVDFTKVTFFHMDDYLGLSPDAPQGFGNWLQRSFIQNLPSGTSFMRMNPQLEASEAARLYAQQIGAAPFDLTLCGLGVNAHLAFNEPGAHLNDPQSVRVIVLDNISRQQQVDEGHFANLEDVPTHALTVTIPRLLNAGHVICSVTGVAKRHAVQATLSQEPNSAVPGTALKLHPRVDLHIDKEAQDE